MGIDNLSHVKPHGALYNKAVNDEDTALGIIEAIKSISSDLIHVVLAGSKWESLAQDQNVKIAKETYADREIMQDGTLCPRSIEGSVIEDSDLIVERTIRMVQKKEVQTFDGGVINVDFDSICLHGDTKGAVEIAKKINTSFEKNNITIAPMSKII